MAKTEEPNLNIEGEGTIKDEGTLNQHVELISDQQASIKEIPQTIEKEMKGTQEDEEGETKEDKNTDAESSEQVISIIEATLGQNNKASVHPPDLTVNNLNKDVETVTEAYTKDKTVDNTSTNDTILFQEEHGGTNLEGVENNEADKSSDLATEEKDPEAFRASEEMGNEKDEEDHIMYDSTEDASFQNVAENPDNQNDEKETLYIRDEANNKLESSSSTIAKYGDVAENPDIQNDEKATLYIGDEAKNKLESSSSTLAKYEAIKQEDGPEVGKKITEASSFEFEEKNQDTIESSNQEKDVTPVVESTEHEGGPEHSLLQQNEPEKEKLERPLKVISEEIEADASRENAETSTCVKEDDHFENPEDKPTATYDISRDEIPVEKQQNLPYLNEKTESAEVEIPNNNANDVHVTHSLVEETEQVEGERIDEVYKSEPEEQIQKSNGATTVEEKQVANASEAYKSTGSTKLEHTSTEGTVAVEIISKTSEITEKLETIYGLDSEEKLEIKDADVNTPEETKKKEDAIDTEIHKISTKSDDTEEGLLEDDTTKVYSRVYTGDETVEQSFQVETLKEAASELSGEDDSHKSENDVGRNNAIIDEAHDGGDVNKEQITEASVTFFAPKPIEEETTKDYQDNEKETVKPREEDETVEQSFQVETLKEAASELSGEDDSHKSENDVGRNNAIIDEAHDGGDVNKEQITEASVTFFAPKPIEEETTKDYQDNEKETVKPREEDETVEQSFQVETLKEAASELSGEDDSHKSENDVGRNNAIIDEAHDGGDVNKEQITEASVTFFAPKPIEEETTKDYQDNEKETVKPREEDDSLEIIKEGNVNNLSPESTGEGPVKNFQDDKKEANKSKVEIFEELQIAGAGVSTAHETNHDDESHEKILDTSLVKQEEGLQGEGQYLVSTEASVENKDEDTSSIIVPEDNDDNNKLVEGLEATENSAKVTPQGEEVSSGAFTVEEKKFANASEAYKSTGSTILEHTSTEGTVTEEITEKLETIYGLDSEEKLEVKDAEVNLPEETKKEEEAIDTEIHKISTKSDETEEGLLEDDTTKVYSTVYTGDEIVEQSFQVETLKEAASKLTGEDESHKSENDVERDNTIIDEAHDGHRITGSGDVNKEQIMEANVTFDAPKPIEETTKDYQDNEKETVKPKEEDDGLEIIKEDNVNNFSPESTGEGSIKNLQDDKKEAKKSKVEIFEEPQIARAGEITAHETNHDVESPEKILDTSLVKQEEGLQGEGQYLVSAEALVENRDEDTSSIIVPEDNDDNNKLVEATENSAKVTPQGEEDSEQVLHIDEPGESIAVESHTNILDTSLPKQKEDQQGEGENLAPTEVSIENKDEDTSNVKVTEDINENNRTGEEDSEHVLQKDEPGESIASETNHEVESPEKILATTPLVKQEEGLAPKEVSIEVREEDTSSIKVAEDDNDNNRLVEDTETSAKATQEGEEHLEHISHKDDPGESIARETNHEVESPEKILDTPLVKKEEGLQGEIENQASTEASIEKRDEDTSSVKVVEDNNDNNGLAEDTKNGANATPEEEDPEHVLQKDELGESIACETNHEVESAEKILGNPLVEQEEGLALTEAAIEKRDEDTTSSVKVAEDDDDNNGLAEDTENGANATPEKEDPEHVLQKDEPGESTACETNHEVESPEKILATPLLEQEEGLALREAAIEKRDEDITSSVKVAEDDDDNKGLAEDTKNGANATPEEKDPEHILQKDEPGEGIACETNHEVESHENIIATPLVEQDEGLALTEAEIEKRDEDTTSSVKVAEDDGDNNGLAEDTENGANATPEKEDPEQVLQKDEPGESIACETNHEVESAEKILGNPLVEQEEGLALTEAAIEKRDEDTTSSVKVAEDDYDNNGLAEDTENGANATPEKEDPEHVLQKDEPGESTACETNHEVESPEKILATPLLEQEEGLALREAAIEKRDEDITSSVKVAEDNNDDDNKGLAEDTKNGANATPEEKDPEHILQKDEPREGIACETNHEVESHENIIATPLVEQDEGLALTEAAIEKRDEDTTSSVKVAEDDGDNNGLAEDTENGANATPEKEDPEQVLQKDEPGESIACETNHEVESLEKILATPLLEQEEGMALTEAAIDKRDEDTTSSFKVAENDDDNNGLAEDTKNGANATPEEKDPEHVLQKDEPGESIECETNHEVESPENILATPLVEQEEGLILTEAAIEKRDEDKTSSVKVVEDDDDNNGLAEDTKNTAQATPEDKEDPEHVLQKDEPGQSIACETNNEIESTEKILATPLVKQEEGLAPTEASIEKREEDMSSINMAEDDNDNNRLAEDTEINANATPEGEEHLEHVLQKDDPGESIAHETNHEVESPEKILDTPLVKQEEGQVLTEASIEKRDEDTYFVKVAEDNHDNNRLAKDTKNSAKVTSEGGEDSEQVLQIDEPGESIVSVTSYNVESPEIFLDTSLVKQVVVLHGEGENLAPTKASIENNDEHTSSFKVAENYDDNNILVETTEDSVKVTSKGDEDLEQVLQKDELGRSPAQERNQDVECPEKNVDTSLVKHEEDLQENDENLAPTEASLENKDEETSPVKAAQDKDDNNGIAEARENSAKVTPKGEEDSEHVLEKDESGKSIACETDHEVESLEEILDTPLVKQEEGLLGKAEDDNHNNWLTEAAEKSAKVTTKVEEDSEQVFEKDESREKLEPLLDVMSEEMEAESSSEKTERTIQNLEETAETKTIDDKNENEVAMEEVVNTTTTGQGTREQILEEIESVKDNSPEPIEKETTTENSEEDQVVNTTTTGQGTGEQILDEIESVKDNSPEPIEKETTKENSEEDQECRGFETEASCTTTEKSNLEKQAIAELSSSPAGEETVNESLQEDESDATELIEEVKGTNLTEELKSGTLQDSAKLNKDFSASTVAEKSFVVSEVSEKENKGKMLEQEEPTINDSDSASVTVASDKIDLKESKPENKEQDKIYDIVSEGKGLATIETEEPSLDSIDIDVKPDEYSNSDENRNKEIPTVADEDGDIIEHEMEDIAHTRVIDYEVEVTTSETPLDGISEENSQDSYTMSLKEHEPMPTGFSEIVEETPPREEITYENEKTPFTAQTTEEKFMQKEDESSRPKDVSEFVSSENGKKSANEEVQKRKDFEGSLTDVVVEKGAAELESGACSHKRDPTNTEDSELLAEKDLESVDLGQKLESESVIKDQNDETLPHTKENNDDIQDQNYESVEQEIIGQKVQDETNRKLEMEPNLEAEDHINVSQDEKETTATINFIEEVHEGVEKADGSENIKEQTIGGESKLNELHTVSAGDKILEEVKDCGLEPTEYLMATDSTEQTETMKSDIEDPTREREAPVTKAHDEERIQDEGNLKATDVSITIAEDAEEKIKEEIKVKVDQFHDMPNTTAAKVVTPESSSGGTQLDEKPVRDTSPDETSLETINTEPSPQAEEIISMKLEKTSSDLVSQLPNRDYNNEEKENITLENPDAHEVSATKTEPKSLGVEAVTEDEITADQTLPAEKLEEVLQTPSPELLSWKQKHGTTTTVEETKEQNMKEGETLDDKDINDSFTTKATEETFLQKEVQLQTISSAFLSEEQEHGTTTTVNKTVEESTKEVEAPDAIKTTEETCLHKEEPRDSILELEINKDIQMDSSKKLNKEEGSTLDESSILEPEEQEEEIKYSDTPSKSENITEITSPIEEASNLSFEKSEKTFESALGVQSHEVLTNSEEKIQDDGIMKPLDIRVAEESEEKIKEEIKVEVDESYGKSENATSKVETAESSLGEAQLNDKPTMDTCPDERSLETIIPESSLQAEEVGRVKLEKTSSNLPNQLLNMLRENAEKESEILEDPDAQEVEKTKTASDAVLESKEQDVHETDGTEQSLTVEKRDAGETEDTKETSETLPKSKALGVEAVRKDEVIANQALPAVKLLEQLQTPFSPLLSSEQEHEGTTTTNERMEEENMKEVKTLVDESIDNSSTAQTTEGTCLIKKELRELEVSELGLESSKEIHMDSSNEVQEEEGRTLDGSSKVEPHEKEEIKYSDYPSESEKNTNLTRSVEVASNLNFEVSKKAFDYVSEVQSPEVHTKSEDINEKHLEAALTDLMTEESPCEKTVEAKKNLKNEILNEEVMEEKGVPKDSGPVSLGEETIIYSHQGDESKAEEIPAEQTNKTLKATTNENQHEAVVLSQVIDKDGASENIEKQITAEDGTVVKEKITECFPDEAEVKNVKGAAIERDLENQGGETNFTKGTTEVITLAEKEPGVDISQKEGTVGFAEVNKITQNIQQLEKTSYAASKTKIPREADLNESTETIIKTGSEDVPPVLNHPLEEALQKAELEDTRPGKVTEVDAEVRGDECEGEKIMGDSGEETTEKSTSVDSAQISLSNLMQRSTKETWKVDKDLTEESEPTPIKEEMQIEEVETTRFDEAKTDEEERHEHKSTDQDFDAPIMVEVSKDIDVKVSHKKSHGILSGVGSKVKHSISKVKKAITGKSSHPKTLSPK